MRFGIRAAPLALFLIAQLFGCNSGGGGGGACSPTSQIRFMADKAPTAGEVTLAETAFTSSCSGGSVFVGVIIRDVNGVFGTEFDLVYDSDEFDFVNAVEGTFLNENGTVPTQLQVGRQPDGPTTERLIFGYARTGAATPDINAVGEQTLLILEFAPKAAPMAMSALDFDNTVGNVQVESSSGAVVVDSSKFSGGDLRIEAL